VTLETHDCYEHPSPIPESIERDAMIAALVSKPDSDAESHAGPAPLAHLHTRTTRNRTQQDCAAGKVLVEGTNEEAIDISPDGHHPAVRPARAKDLKSPVLRPAASVRVLKLAAR
jgi:hypothetical protein